MRNGNVLSRAKMTERQYSPHDSNCYNSTSKKQKLGFLKTTVSYDNGKSPHSGEGVGGGRVEERALDPGLLTK